jgi:non-canonical purine NTP pyrophosphatase (RdgB/HAM1 family)
LLIPSDIVVATENLNKGRELSAILRNHLTDSVRIVSLRDIAHNIVLPDETGRTFCENAAQKAEAVATATGMVSLGDDSGLCVACLGGAPGILSRRWAGVDDDHARNQALLAAMTECSDRSASFVCCVAIAEPGKPALGVVGECNGRILSSGRGQKGFGYDPLFLVDGLNQTMSELDDEQKNLYSHRAAAIQNLFVSLGWSRT